MQKRLRQGFAALLFGVGLTVAAAPSARAQSTWNGGSDYNNNANWTPATTPVAAGQSAVFDAAGTDTVNVSAAIATNSWTFNPNSQSYSISGSGVNFSLAGATGGLINNASAGQFIGIFNNIGESVAGVQLQQLGASTLVLAGTNTYTGGTLISAGTVQVRNNSSVGTGAVTMDGGTF